MPIVSTKGLAPVSGVLDNKKAMYLLRRTLFGVSRSDITAFVGKNISDAVDELLIASPAPNPPVNHYNNSKPDANVAYGQTWVNAPFDLDLQGDRMFSFKAWLVSVMLTQNHSITEKMSLFFQNLMPVESDSVTDPRMLYRNYLMIRRNCLGNFKTLIKENSIDIAMLQYLNGEKNNKNAPDENYGRELQELFTLGKGVDSKYTEDDVKQAAKVLTGYQINRNTLSYFFNSSLHDTSNKTFSSFYGNTTITGKTGAQGEQELQELIDMIFQQQEVAKHFCRKLYKFFVYYDIDATIEANVISPLAQIFVNNNWDIKPVLKALFLSEHFWDSENYGAHIKSPLDFMLGYMKEMEIALPSTSDYETYYKVLYEPTKYAALIRQEVYNPPSVSGWEAYYQLPLYHENWINTDTITRRNQISAYLLYGYNVSGFRVQADVIEFTKKFATPSDPNLLIDDALTFLHTIAATAPLKASLKSILLFNQTQDHYWTDAWNAYINDPTNASKKNTVTGLLTAFYKYIFDMAEYQLY